MSIHTRRYKRTSHLWENVVLGVCIALVLVLLTTF